MARRFSRERLAPWLHSCVSFSHRSGSKGPNRSRGSISRITRYTCGRALRGIIFPPSLLQAQQEGPCQQAQGHMVMPARPGAGLVLVQAYVAFLRLELRFYAPAGASHVCQGLQRGILRSVGQVVAGFAPVQVAAIDGPVDVAGLTPADWTHPLGTEPVAAGPLGFPGPPLSPARLPPAIHDCAPPMARRCPATNLAQIHRKGLAPREARDERSRVETGWP